MAEQKPAAVRRLAACGLEFVYIPAADYQIGWRGENSGLGLSPGYDFYGKVQTTPFGIVETAGFYIAVEPLRLSHLQHPEFTIRSADHILTPKRLEKMAARRKPAAEVEIQPTASQQQYDDERTPFKIAQQIEADPPILVNAMEAQQLAKGLKCRLPQWDEWEIGMRGADGLLYPWGNELDRKALSLEYQNYSVDTESTMGYYSYDQDVYFIHSFGRYASMASPFGLRGLARPGREWNVADDRLLDIETKLVMRSVSDLGHMALMVPGNRPNTWGSKGWHQTKRQLPFSGPILPAYTAADGFYKQAAVRLIVAG